jgi:putative spermidine/putrescine transport system permease protein
VVLLLIAPLLTSVIMRTVGIQMILARRGALNALFDLLGLPLLPPGISSGSFAVYVGMVQVLVPFMVLSIAPVLQSIDRTLEDAARILGADQLKTFVEVTLPLSKNGILTGCILVFMMANGSFVTQLLLGGGKVITMPVLIFQQFNVTQEAAFAGAMGNVLLVLCLASLLLQFVLIGRSKRRAI